MEPVEDEAVEDFDEAGGEDMLRCWGGFFFLKIVVEGMYLYIRDHNSSNKG